MQEHTMKKRMTVMAIALAVVFGGLIAFNIIKSMLVAHFMANYTPPAVSVSSAEVQSINWEPSISSVGNFLAINGVDVGSEATGNVVQINFESGQYVVKDDPLITIDDSVDQAQLKFNQAELTLKELNYKRQTDLYKRNATPSSSVDEARANLLQAQAHVEQIQAQINHKHIKAPFDGRLGIRQINIGEYITPGQTNIVSLQSLDPLYLEFYLPEQFYKNVSADQKITFAVEEFPNALFEATITAVNSKVDLTTHNMQIQATLPNCPAEAIKDPTHSPLIKARQQERGSKLIVSCNTELNKKNKIRNFVFVPGMFASIDIAQPAQPNTLVVPSTAISYTLYGNAVYVINPVKDQPKQFTVERTFVKTGPQQGNYTVIKKGLKAGQVVVSTGDLKLQNGTAISINNEVNLNKELNPKTLNP